MSRTRYPHSWGGNEEIRKVQCILIRQRESRNDTISRDAAWKIGKEKTQKPTKENTAELPKETQSLGKRLDGGVLQFGQLVLRLFGLVDSVCPRCGMRNEDLERGAIVDMECVCGGGI